MTVITHPIFTEKRNEFEDKAFDAFHVSVDEYVAIVELYLAKVDNEQAKNILAKFIMIHERSKSPSLMRDQRILYVDIIHASMKILTYIISESEYPEKYTRNIILLEG